MILSLDQQGMLTVSSSSNAEDAVLDLEFETHSYLADTELEIAFMSKVANPQLSDIVMRMRIVDSVMVMKF